MAIKKTADEIVYQFFINTFLALILLAVVVPLWHVVISSFTPQIVVNDSTFGLLVPPWNWNLAAYEQLTHHPMFFRAALNSTILLVGGVAASLFITVPLAYVLSVKAMPGRKIMTGLILIPFLFHPGLIPVYITITSTFGLSDNLLAIIVPACANIYNTFVMRSFFEGLPEELKEAARIDGASELYILFRIIMPLSKPILLTIGLFYGVSFWNEFFNPILYINSNELQPLPVLLRNILLGSAMNESVDATMTTMATISSIKSASVIMTTLPMLFVYPWIQKYFTKGTLAGGVKG